MSLLITEAVAQGVPGKPTGVTATPGDRTVTLNWELPSNIARDDINGFGIEMTGPDGVTQSFTFAELNPPDRTTSALITALPNGGIYTFRVRSRSSNGFGEWSASVEGMPMIPAPDTFTATAGDGEVTLSWTPPSSVFTPITSYEYSQSQNGGNWETAGDGNSRSKSIRSANGIPGTFRVRAARGSDKGTASQPVTVTPLRDAPRTPVRDAPRTPGALNVQRVADTAPKPKGRIRIQECPVGWVRSDGFARPNRRVLLYEVNLEMDLENPRSIYKPVSVAIYVHPDEALENLHGWKLHVAIPYNHHRAYLLTAENAVVVDAKIERVEGGFAFIESPEENPFPMVGVGFAGSSVPGFDYRLYDERGKRVDFGISCYKRSDVFQALRDMENPRVLRKVLLETLDWDAHYIRTEWTVPVPVNGFPGAPALHGVNLVGKWAALKKQ